MKLELKHLAPYLPYELKLWDKENKGVYIPTLIGIKNEESIVTSLPRFPYSITLNINEFKPILRPLSDLTDGNVKELFGDKFSSNKCMLYDGTLNLDTSDLSSVNLIYYLPQINKLFEYHFDVFGLIEKGLAIDINKTK